MAVYINYINKHQNFLFEEDNEEDIEDNSFINFNLKLSDIFNTNYIKEKLKELLFQKIPAIASASLDIVKLILNILINACKNIIKKISETSENVYNAIKEIFNKISNIITDIFIQSSNTVIFKLKEIFNSEIVIAADFSESDTEKKILDKIKQSPNIFEIKFSETDKINEFCKLEETKLFIIEAEENYLCLPFNDNDENKFKVIKTVSYYDAEFDISDQESDNLLNIILELKESGKKIFEIGSGDKKISVKFLEYNKDRTWNGTFSEWDKCIQIQIRSDLNYLHMYATLAHEYIHYKDKIINKGKFTNDELDYIIAKLGEKFKKGDVVSYDEITEFLMSDTAILLEINNPSIVRYIVAILQKKHLVQYLPNDYTKFKFISKIPNLKSKDADDFYYASDIELNTQASSLIHDMLRTHKEIWNGYVTEDLLDLIIKHYIVDYGYGNDILDEYKRNNPDLKLPNNSAELKKITDDLMTNYKNKIKEKLPAYIKNFKSNQQKINKLNKLKKDSYDLELTTDDIENYDKEESQKEKAKKIKEKKIKAQLKNKKTKEFALSDNLLRQYVSLLIH